MNYLHQHQEPSLLDTYFIACMVDTSQIGIRVRCSSCQLFLCSCKGSLIVLGVRPLMLLLQRLSPKEMIMESERWEAS